MQNRHQSVMGSTIIEAGSIHVTQYADFVEKSGDIDTFLT